MSISPGARPTVAGSRIAALGHYLPERIVPSEEVAARLSVDGPWIVARTGIRERRFAAPGETVADMATRAALAAFERLEPGRDKAIDLVVVATSTAESTMPATAATVAHRLGLAGPAAFDIASACAGFCHALG